MNSQYAQAVYNKVSEEIQKPKPIRKSYIQLAREITLEYGYPESSIRSLRMLISKEFSEREDSDLDIYLQQQGIDKKNVKTVWHKTKGYSIKTDHTSAQLDPKVAAEAFIDLTKSYAPIYPTEERPKPQGENLLVISPADLHLGKLSTIDDYDRKIATQRLLEGVHGVYEKAYNFGIGKVVFVTGNDFLHTDHLGKSTTKGTPQDTDHLWYDNFKLGLHSQVIAIDNLRRHVPVHVIHNTDNHSYANGWMLTQALKAWYRQDEYVTFDDGIEPRKYFQFGKNLIGTTHGDKIKWDDLPILMAYECPKGWAESKFRYMFTHHVHHKIILKHQVGKDYIGVTVESLRSPCGNDLYHSIHGYTGSPKAIEGFIHNPNHGQSARITHHF